MSGLRLEGVGKTYGPGARGGEPVPALSGVDLEVGRGELLTVLGPSGSGKSTLLRVVAGLEQVSRGRVLLGGRDVTALAPGRRNVSMVFQSYALFPHLTVLENISFGLEVRDLPKRQARERARGAAELVGCAALLERRPPQLSGGERQRVALARAIVREPALFLLDEPLSNLDAELRVQMRAELLTLQRRVGATMLYVTHDQVEALALGDRVAVLRGGQLEQVGTPDALWQRPANRFVARFVGNPAMNLLPGEPAAALLGAAGLPPGGLRDVEVGVRPDALHLLPADPARPVTPAGPSGTTGVTGPTGAACAHVTLVERVGADAHVHLRAGEHRLLARVPADARPAPGTAVALGVRREDLHVFDARTGRRVP